jgi:hypothetical protein
MQTSIETKDKKRVTIYLRNPVPDEELEALRNMTKRRLYHVSYITGFVDEA